MHIHTTNSSHTSTTWMTLLLDRMFSKGRRTWKDCGETTNERLTGEWPTMLGTIRINREYESFHVDMRFVGASAWHNEDDYNSHTEPQLPKQYVFKYTTHDILMSSSCFLFGFFVHLSCNSSCTITCPLINGTQPKVNPCDAKP